MYTGWFSPSCWRSTSTVLTPACPENHHGHVSRQHVHDCERDNRRSEQRADEEDEPPAGIACEAHSSIACIIGPATSCPKPSSLLFGERTVLRPRTWSFAAERAVAEPEHHVRHVLVDNCPGLLIEQDGFVASSGLCAASATVWSLLVAGVATEIERAVAGPQ